MTKHHDDDEAVHWRARVDAIPMRDPGPTPEPMSEARIAEYHEDAEIALNDDHPEFRGPLVRLYARRVLELTAVIAERDAAMRDLLPMAEAWYDHNCDYGGYDPINGDWAMKQGRHDADVISRAKALLAGEAVPE